MASGSQPVVGMGEYVAAVRRWWLPITGLTIVGLIAGWAVLQSGSKTYQSEALVQVNPLVRQSDEPMVDTDRLVNIETELAIAGSQRVAEIALAARDITSQTGTDDFDSETVLAQAFQTSVERETAVDAMERLEVTVVGDSHVLLFRSQADDPDSARRLAQSTAVAFLEFRRQNAGLDPDELQRRLSTRASTIEAELSDLAEAIVADGNKDAALSLGYADVARSQELVVLGTKLANLETLLVDPGVVLTDAINPDNPTGLSPLVGPLSGGLLGLILGVSIALSLSRPNEPVRIDEDSWGVVEERVRSSTLLR